jgi:hypothetical protein
MAEFIGLLHLPYLKELAKNAVTVHRFRVQGSGLRKKKALKTRSPR